MTWIEALEVNTADVADLGRIGLEALQRIGNVDPERAHGLEDDLMRTVLRDIAAGYPEPKKLARAALEAVSGDYERWHA